ncbi:MAG TPA: flagellar biosynthesis protein FlhA [Spirochaetota bacterium]|nr:flagellar biosynthesis protein FlhA [Spirochaetota bacterium]HPP03762.1 flagellar biosynthesis protein FlhA [Spirochaetota bacterium]
MSDSKESKRGFNFRFDLKSAAKDPTMVFAVFIVVTVLMLIIPMPAFVLDFLMALSILSGVLIIVTVSYLKSAVEFSIFPSVLLATTIFRLAVNVSSTRLILSQGVNFEGKMVRAFGQFVVGTTDASGMVIGIIIFAILTLVQFIVITRGSTRVAEVAARFSLDSMPNKYMAIDMDLQNGVIDEAEAVRRRLELQEESSFYGNMDGASKFVQGDVIMSIIITLVNIIGGFTVGMLVRGEDFNIALQNYIPLTVGDGLVSQIPSLLISTATGLIVTRSQSKDAIGGALWKQVSAQYKVFYIGAGALTVLAALPGFPHITLLLLASGMAFAAYSLQKAEKKSMEEKKIKKEEKMEQKGPENVTQLLKVDPLALNIGFELIPLVDKKSGGELLDAITGVRKTLALDLGLIVPPIRIQDSMKLQSNEYCFKLRGQEIGRGEIKIGYLMAMGENYDLLEGEKTTEPAFGMPALWIKNSDRDKAESLGFTVVDATTIISTHIQELLKSHSHEILGREETNQLIENIKSENQTLIDDVLKDYSKATIQKILQQLLKEGVSIRDLITIFETLTEYSPQTPVAELVEYVRIALKRVISNKFADISKKIHVLRVNPKIENEIYKNIEFEKDGTPVIRLKPDVLHSIQIAIKNKVTEMFNSGYAPLILTQPPIRRAMFEICYHINRHISVISTREIVPDVEVVLFGQISIEEKERVGV